MTFLLSLAGLWPNLTLTLTVILPPTLTLTLIP
jgi:hypothetical protein